MKRITGERTKMVQRRKILGEREGLFGWELGKLSAWPVYSNQICQIITHLPTSQSLLSIHFHSCILNLALTSDNWDLASGLFSDLVLANIQGSDTLERCRRDNLSCVAPLLALRPNASELWAECEQPPLACGWWGRQVLAHGTTQTFWS